MENENLDIEVLDDPSVDIEVSEDSQQRSNGDSNDGDNSSGDDESLDARRQKGQAARLSRGQRQRNARVKRDEQLEATQRELNEMRERDAVTRAELAQLRKMGVQFQSQSVADKLKESQGLVDYWQKEYVAAMSAGDTAKAMQLQTTIAKEQNNIANFTQQKQSFDSTAQQIDPQALLADQQRLNMQNRWLSKNSWYNDPRYAEEKSIATAIDAQVLSDGYNPTTKAYWAELERRIKASEINYVADDDEPVENNKKTPKVEPRMQKQVVSGASSQAPSSTSKKMQFTSHQLTALRHQGIVDQDNKPVAGKEADLKYYHNYWQANKK